MCKCGCPLAASHVWWLWSSVDTSPALDIAVFVCSGCFDKVPQTQWLKHLKFIVSQFWMPRFWNQGSAGLVPSGGFWWFAGSLWRSLSLPSSSHGWSLCTSTCLLFLSHIGLGPILLQCDFILTNYIYNDSFPLRSHSEVLGVRISTWIWGTQFNSWQLARVLCEVSLDSSGPGRLALMCCIFSLLKLVADGQSLHPGPDPLYCY